MQTSPPKPTVNVYLGYPLFDEVGAAARTEPVRGKGAFVLEVFLYGWQVYRRVRSLKALRELREKLETLSPGAQMPQMAASRETYAELLAALELILERAPVTVIEKVAEDLTRYAGQYAEPRELRQAQESVKQKAQFDEKTKSPGAHPAAAPSKTARREPQGNQSPTTPPKSTQRR